MKTAPKTIEHIKVDDLIPYATNSRTHSAEQVAQIAASMVEFGWTNPVLIDARGTIVAGHGRVMAARKLGMEAVPCIRLGHLTPSQIRAYVIADNKLALNAGWDEAMLKAELDILKEEGFDIGLTGFSDSEIEELLAQEDGENSDSKTGAGSLSEKFLVPPFTVLNAREGWWMDRKRQWLATGIKSELGRGEDGVHGRTYGQDLMKGEGKAALMTSLSGRVPDYYQQKRAAEKKVGRKLENPEFEQDHLVIPEGGGLSSSGTSVFDPVLCELSYRWFCPTGGTVIDPFAGGSVRGIVASKLGRRYVGHELRAEQVKANRAQAETICENDPMPPVWVIGDSRQIHKTCSDVRADMLMTCPPYADLEVYSEDPADISTLDYADFRGAYSEIIQKACALLVPDSFAVCVVGEVRDKGGAYLDFVGDTVQAFRDAGLIYYNEAILVTAVGSLPIRAGKQFSASRKLGKTHQNVLVFVKGDGKRAAQRCGVVEVSEISLGNTDDELLAVLPQ